MNHLLRHDTRCRICGSERVATVLKLADTPLEEQFLKEPAPQQTFPLEVALCEDCGYYHLPYIVSPEASYSDYLYVTSSSVDLRTHYDEYARSIVSAHAIPEGSLVIDMGSNDGSMLAPFKRLGMNVLGVEPVETAARFANENGLPTINDFFTEDVAQRILEHHGPAKVVTANYMYANVDDLIGFTRQVAGILDRDGIFVVQTGYHPEQMKINMFDYVYHEHFSYFTVEVLESLFARCGLQMISAAKTAPKGGSVRVTAQLQGGSRPVESSVPSMIEEERNAGMREPETYRLFAERVQAEKQKVLNLLRELRGRGEKIAGFGASHSTTTLIHHFELAEYMDYLVDDNTRKHGRFSPGKHIPVFPTQKLYEDAPCNILLLAWQHQKTILDRHKEVLEQGSRFIVPLPSLRTVPSASVDSK